MQMEQLQKDMIAAMKARDKVRKDAISSLVSAAKKFSDVIATGNKGQIMKAVMPHFKGKADGKVINQVVAKLCAK